MLSTLKSPLVDPKFFRQPVNRDRLVHRNNALTLPVFSSPLGTLLTPCST